MLRVALNGRFTGTPQPTGTQTASFQLFNAILRESGETKFVVFADSRFPGVEEWKHLERVNFVETPFQDWSRAVHNFGNSSSPRCWLANTAASSCIIR